VLWVFVVLQVVVVAMLRALRWMVVLIVWLAASLTGTAVGATQRAWRRRRPRPREVTW
jgi:hypothetical protein